MHASLIVAARRGAAGTALALALAACAVKGPLQQGPMATDLQPRPLFDQARHLSLPSDPLIAGLPAHELKWCAARARIKFTPYWPVVSERSRYVRHRILQILRELRAPEALQVVPVVESTYDPYALSYSGAMGLWQLMPRTARGLGVMQTPLIDGRRHVEISTRAAVRYLQQLHDRFDSWPLAFAAYHMGPNALARRLQAHPWHAADGVQAMPVPEITKEYVRNIIGLALLVDQGAFRFEAPIRTAPVQLAAPFDLQRLQRHLGKDEAWVFRFNPGLNLARAGHPVTIHVPADEIAQWRNRPALPLPKFRIVKVHKGDSLWKIARRHRLSVAALKAANGLRSNRLRIGQQLKIPAADGTVIAATNPLLSNGKRLRYSVRKGDSLWKIARRFGTTPAAIARANNMSLHTPIYPGDKIWVHARLRRHEG